MFLLKRVYCYMTLRALKIINYYNNKECAIRPQVLRSRA